MYYFKNNLKNPDIGQTKTVFEDDTSVNGCQGSWHLLIFLITLIFRNNTALRKHSHYGCHDNEEVKMILTGHLTVNLTLSNETVLFKMAENLQKRPAKGILKNSSSFDKQESQPNAKWDIFCRPRSLYGSYLQVQLLLNISRFVNFMLFLERLKKQNGMKWIL